MRTMFQPILLIAVLGQAGCPSGAQGPAGPRGPAGVAGTTGAAGASAVMRITSVSAGSTCAAGGQLVEAGTDTNGNRVLDDAEVTTSASVCDGVAGVQGPTGPASAWQLVSADGFTFGQVTGFDGWLWNAGLGGFLPKPVAQGTDLVIQMPAAVHRIYFANGGCAGGNSLYIQPSSLGPEVLPHDALIPEVSTTTQIFFYTVAWRVAPAAANVGSFMDFPAATCANVGGQVPGLVRLSPVGPIGRPTLVDRVHPGPASLQPVTVP